ncbi:hypothetical protein J6590_028362 [Homalodisca vitripennis]|nr:hypothetical protein J6590_028362 [Homalodisca vitripennis]
MVLGPNETHVESGVTRDVNSCQPAGRGAHFNPSRSDYIVQRLEHLYLEDRKPIRVKRVTMRRKESYSCKSNEAQPINAAQSRSIPSNRETDLSFKVRRALNGS